MNINGLGDPRENELQSLIKRREEALSQIKQYDHEIESLEKAKRQEIVTSVRQQIEQWGLRQEELFPKREVKTKVLGVPKYQHPDNPSLVWSGRGPKPKWVKDWIQNDGTLEGLLKNK